MEIFLPEAYLSYPSLGKPVSSKLYPDQSPRFKAALVFPKGTDLTALNDTINKVIADKLSGKQPKNCFLKPSSKAVDSKTGLVQPLYQKGDFYVDCWNSEDYPPVLLGPDAKAGYSAAHFKGGNMVQASINVWGSSTFGGSIGASIMAIQWRGEGSVVTPQANLNNFSAAPQKASGDVPANMQQSTGAQDNWGV